MYENLKLRTNVLFILLLAVSGPISQKMYAVLPCGGIGVRLSVLLFPACILGSNTQEFKPEPKPALPPTGGQ